MDKKCTIMASDARMHKQNTVLFAEEKNIVKV